MTKKRAPSRPPEIAGFTPIEPIGSGGYADVFLYEQHMPRRRVAVKVLIGDSLPGDRQRPAFTAEANLMARVSAHPYIVQIFQADIAPDGRPYLVMEYYPGPNYLDRARKEQMSVAEVLRTGVQLASAVETAHRVGILHRDIKPANVLTSEFHRPGLTDFGIASAQGPQADGAGGLSIPWSPPESFGDAELDVRGDVYSLAATLYTLLTGRSPFAVPGGDNSSVALISRIERLSLPPTGRSDVPPSLERLLAVAMAKRADQRPGTAIELARLLQGVEEELRLSVTPLELAGERTAKARDRVVDDDSTRIKGVTELQAQQSQAVIDVVPSNPTTVAAPSPRRREGLLAEPEIADTVHRKAPPPDDAAPQADAVTSRRRWAIIGAAAAAVLLVAAGALALSLGAGGSSPEPGPTEAEVNDGLDQADSPAIAPLPVEEVAGTANADGSFTFTWTAADGTVGQFAVTEDGSDVPRLVDDARYIATTRCIDVEAIAENGLVSTPVRGCAD